MCIFVLCLIIKSNLVMRLIPSKTLVRHAEDSTMPAPCGSWLNYWSETLGVEFPQSGYVSPSIVFTTCAPTKSVIR